MHRDRRMADRDSHDYVHGYILNCWMEMTDENGVTRRIDTPTFLNGPAWVPDPRVQRALAARMYEIPWQPLPGDDNESVV